MHELIKPFKPAKMPVEDIFIKPSNEICTSTGKFVDPLNLNYKLVCIEDIAIALSNQCRFAGHLDKFYSVAEHSINLSNFDPDPEIALLCLLHDATEAYLLDIPRPWKDKVFLKIKTFDSLITFSEYETMLIKEILKGLGCLSINKIRNWRTVKYYDNLALEVELETVKGMYCSTTNKRYKSKNQNLVSTIKPTNTPNSNIAIKFVERFTELYFKVYGCYPKIGSS